MCIVSVWWVPVVAVGKDSVQWSTMMMAVANYSVKWSTMPVCSVQAATLSDIYRHYHTIFISHHCHYLPLLSWYSTAHYHGTPPHTIVTCCHYYGALMYIIVTHHRAGRVDPTIPTLAGPKILPFMVKVPFLNLWLDQ